MDNCSLFKLRVCWPEEMRGCWVELIMLTFLSLLFIWRHSPFLTLSQELSYWVAHKQSMLKACVLPCTLVLDKSHITSKSLWIGKHFIGCRYCHAWSPRSLLAESAACNLSRLKYGFMNFWTNCRLWMNEGVLKSSELMEENENYNCLEYVFLLHVLVFSVFIIFFCFLMVV